VNEQDATLPSDPKQQREELLQHYVRMTLSCHTPASLADLLKAGPMKFVQDSKREERQVGFTAAEYLRVYQTLKDLYDAFLVKETVKETFETMPAEIIS
jgi:hypothetical protein